MFDDKGEMDGQCSTIRCQYIRGSAKPKATWINTSRGQWICFTCAQDVNRAAMQLQLKYGVAIGKPVCIPAQEYVLKLLSETV